ncbi:DNA adenine methylase [Psychrobacter sp. 2Y5]
MSTKPLMRYHGAKWRLAPWIISHFPQHNCYVEPFGVSYPKLFYR